MNSHSMREPTIVNNGTPYVSNDDIVISGFSGRLPESSTIEEFKEQLFQGVDLITDDERRWPKNIYGLPARTGKLKDLASFDATFFGVHAKQANVMDPQLRMLLELTHEAIIDAGISPVEIRGTKTGVFIGVFTSESHGYWSTDPGKINGYEITGCSRAMLANRISYTFDFNGPSFSLDTACSSSLYAMHHAIAAMRTGECDAAIVGGTNLLLNPTSSLQFHRLGMSSPDGSCKSFDASANGYVRSEAAVVIYLQKSRDARRIYATVVNSKVNTDGYKDQGITFPNGGMQNKLMREIYGEVGVNPTDVAYIEAHGTGTIAGDKQEINSIAELFCKDRKTPLLLGSVKSNMGHSEATSGLCSVAKVLIAMEKGVLPANLHFKNPNKDIPALTDGSIRVVTEPTPWKGGLAGINSFGFGGANAHVLLKSNPKPKISPMLDLNIPKMVAVSGRTNEAVASLLNEVKKNVNDDEFISLVHSVHALNIPGHLYRGYQILGDEEEREISQMTGEKRPVWYVFSGMGSQWAGMGKDLMSISTFSDSLRLCSEVLKLYGVDLMNLILNGTEETYEDVVHSFICIVAIQVALVDVLSILGISPDGIIGHSFGELGCAYADGTLTAEQTILTAYWRGRNLKEIGLSESMGMAAVGLSWAEAKERCPVDVFPACHNAADSVSVSGPVASLQKFISQLQAEGIFAKNINSSGVAFHSKYIADAGPKFQTNLEKIIPSPKPRTARWISSSVPESAWGTPLAQLSSPAYHANNLLSPVLFQEALAHVPDNAVVIEVAPHCLLQAILRRSLPSTVTNVGLQKRDHKNNLMLLLTNIGKIYNAGVQLQLGKFYPPVSYPVGRGTPMLNSVIKWDHSIQWDVPDFSGKHTRSGDNIVEVDLSKDADAHLAGHIIDGRVLYPAAGYLIMVWKTFAKLQGAEFEKMPVVMEDLHFERATIMPKDGSVKFKINIFDGSGEFEICEGGSIAVTGKVRKPEDVDKEQLNLQPTSTPSKPELLELNTVDIYKELRLRGYDYTSDTFQGIVSSDNFGNAGKLMWNEDWVSYIDTMLQFIILSKNTRDLYLPTSLQEVIINPIAHKELIEKAGKGRVPLPVQFYSKIGVIKSGGVELRNMKTSWAPRRHQTQASLKCERYTFVPYDNSHVLHEDPERSKSHALDVLLQIVKENTIISKIKAVEFTGERASEVLMTPTVLDIVSREPMLSIDLQIATTSPNSHSAFVDQWKIKAISKDIQSASVDQDFGLVLVADLLSNNQTAVLKNIADCLKPGGFLISEETGAITSNVAKEAGLLVVSKQVVPGKSYVLIKKLEDTNQPIIIQITEKNFSWLEDVKAALKKAEFEKQKVLLVSQGEELNGIVGLMNCIHQEAGDVNVRYVFIQDKNVSEFSLADDFYADQINKQLMANVLKGGKWGSYRHLSLDQQTDVSSLHVEHAYINSLTRGDLSSLRWIEGPLSYYQPENFPGKEFCNVYYAPLNFRDIMLSTGKLNPDALPGDLTSRDCILGMEFAGRDSKGRRVMGIVAAKGLATTVLADPGFMWEVPDKWTLEQAATIPVAYATSYYALCVRGNMKPGESVLIHDGTGGVGQASIAIALHMGCKVFTTDGSQEKRDFLKKTFPQLNDCNIGNSRDTSFEQLIRNETGGHGVDLVLNSLADEKLQASLRCLAYGGRFLEIGKSDLSQNVALGVSFFLKNTSFLEILLDNISDTENKEVVRLVSEGIKNGVVQPLPATVFNEQQVEQAFRFMATDNNIGKVLLKIRDEEAQKVSQPTRKTIASIPRTYMNPGKSYVLAGGLGGFGLELANWLITRGAKHVILTSLSGVRTGYQSLCIRRWRDNGINIVISTLDATTIAGAEKLINLANESAPVGGIFNLAAVFKDALIEKLEEDDFKAVALPKINGTKNLDAASRKLCPVLDYFVAFSSISSGRGNVGQTNYGLANSAMERICEQRQAIGLPGLAIQWGAIGDVGVILDKNGNNETEIAGTLPQRLTSCLTTIEMFLQQPHPVLSSMVVAEKHKSSNAGNRVGLLEVVGNVLGIKDIKIVNPNNSLADLGMDSLMSTEVKQTLERNYGIVLSHQEIRGLTFGKLTKFAAGGGEAPESPEKPAVRSPTKKGPNTMLFQLSGSEIVPKETLIKLNSHNFEGTPIFLVSDIEGVINPLKPLAQEISDSMGRPVYGLQCVTNASLDSITEFAKFNIKQIKEVQKQGPYTVVGYSFGAMVAFEMALQLEQMNEQVNLTLVDGSPGFVKQYCENIEKQHRRDNESLETDGRRKVLAFFTTQMNSDNEFLKTYSILSGTQNDDEMFKKIVELIGSTPYSPEDLKEAGILFFKRMWAAMFYKPSSKYQGHVMLIKAKENFMPWSNDYELSQICTQNVKVEELLGNHKSIVVGDNAKKIVELLRA